MFAPILYLLLAATPIDYSPCAHTPDGARPAFDADHQEETRTLIREVVAELGGSETLARYLIAVATHESSLQRGLIHRLPQDVAGARRAYLGQRARLRREGHPLAAEPRVWLTYGLFGMTAAYHYRHLGLHADPRQLCDAAASVRAYVAAARAALPKLRRAVRRPTLADLYRAIQRGRIRPDGRRDDWPRLARAHGLDPQTPLNTLDFGQ